MLGLFKGKKQIAFLNEQLLASHTLNDQLAKDLVAYKDKVENLEKELREVKTILSSLNMTKFNYTVNDIVHNRRCLAPHRNNVGLRRIVEIAGDWTIIMEDDGDSSYRATPSQLIDFKQRLNKNVLSKEDLARYLIEKNYVLESD